MLSRTKTYILTLFFLIIHSCYNWCLQKNWTVGAATSVDYSPDGKYIAVGGISNNSVLIYDAVTFNFLFAVNATVTSPANTVRISRNNLIAIGYKNGNIQVMDLTNRSPITISISGQTIINSVDFSPSGQLLAVCGNSAATIYNLSTPTSMTSIGTISTGFIACSFTYDSNLLTATSATPSVVGYYSGPNFSGSIANSTSYSLGGISCLAYRFDNATTYTYITGSDSKSNQFVSKSNTTNLNVTGAFTCSYSKALDFFIFGGSSMLLSFFNGSAANSNTLIFQFNLAQNISSSDFSDDGIYLVVSTSPGNILIYTQKCNACNSTSFYNFTANACQLCSNYTALTGCSGCYNSTTCYHCFQGYYLVNGLCKTCFSAIPGCSVCLNDTNCKVASLGYYVNTTTNLTAQCSSAIPGCQNCNSSTICNQCYSQYYLNNSNICAPCVNNISNCLKCLGPSNCVQCQLGFYLASSPSTCTACSSNCLSCNSTRCLACAVGYYPNTSTTTCTQCSTNCLACNSTGSCINCKVGMFISSGNCSNCNAPCLTCSDATTCVSCVLGYYLNNSNACISCLPACLTCKVTANFCLSCVQGSYLSDSANGICSVCNQNCQSCNATACILCYTGFYPNGTNCAPCGTAMHACQLCTTNTTCLFCAPEHYLSTTNSCLSCPLGCSTCESASNCSSCTVGYYYAASSFNCQLCTGLCTTCVNSPTSCLSCIVGYILVSSTCASCNQTYPGCVACNSDQKCIQCGIGQYLLSGVCSLCSGNCVTCNSSTTCLSCPLSYYLNTNNFTCSPCTPLCEQCDSNGSCTFCKTGYYISTSTCNPCPDNCVTCTSTSNCLSCVAGYFLKSTQCVICSSSISNCLVCDESNKCYQCAYGYALSATNTSCTSCSSLSGCYHCSTTSTCLACSTGFYLNGTSCTPCFEGCMVCSDSVTCLSCSISYFLGNFLTPPQASQNGKCLRCINSLSGCELCNDNTHCISCISGYFIDTTGPNTTCTLCEYSIDYCQICNSSNICISCKGGYFLSTDYHSCIQCSLQACQVCNGNGTGCDVCQSGYYVNNVNDNLCSLCADKLTGCQICSNSNACVQCQSGYFLSGVTCTLCQTPMAGCIFCTSGINCLSCDSGYYINSGFTCSQCAVVDCQVCLQSNPSKCVTCSSLYYKNTSSSTGCSLCRLSIDGCLTCVNQSNCSKCDVGYYLDNAKCTPCSPTMLGCSICSSSNTCLQCESMYFLNSTSNQCQICSQTIVGCTFCTNDPICISCGSGYFINSSGLCEPCTKINGCLMCRNANKCLFCDTGYYLDTNVCNECKYAISGCYSCINSTICSSCVGGYTLNTDYECDEIVVKADLPTTDLILKTFYVDPQTLIHYLYSKGMNFTKVDIDWANNMLLSIVASNGTTIDLVIISVNWYDGNNYTLIIKSNNPLDYQSKFMPFTRRLLATSINLSNYKTGITLTQEATNLILPQYQHTGPLLVDYNLNNPEFYQSYIGFQESHFKYYIIGTIIVIILFIKYLVKALVSAPHSPNIGNIIPHILAYKVGALLLYPTYTQYINYCLGFMYADFYMFTKSLKHALASLTDQRDVSPAAFSVFYMNMNLASTYLLAICILIFLGIIGFIAKRNLGAKYADKVNAFFTFLYNFFAFGAVFAGCISVQGSIMNHISFLNVNGIFYIFGVLLYSILFCQCIYMLNKDKHLNFWKIRIFIKSTLLSLSHFSPIYLVLTTVLIDLVLIVFQYRLSSYPKLYKQYWIFANVLVNLALILLIFLPIIVLTLVLVTLSIFCIIIAQGIMHYYQYQAYKRVVKLEQTADKQKNDMNVWDLNIQDISDINVLNKTSNNSQNTSKINKNQFNKDTSYADNKNQGQYQQSKYNNFNKYQSGQSKNNNNMQSKSSFDQNYYDDHQHQQNKQYQEFVTKNLFTNQ